MRIRFAAGLFSLIALSGLVFSLAAQEKKTKPSNIQGLVKMIDKDKSTISIGTGSGNVTRDVVYSGDTQFMYGHSNNNKPGSLDQVKEGYFMSCSGTFDHGKPQLMAKQCVYREAK